MSKQISLTEYDLMEAINELTRTKQINADKLIVNPEVIV